jgi:hypothetical protein
MARASCGKRARKVGEECDEKVVVEEGNGVGFILEAGSRPTRVGRGRAARALEQLGLQGPYARRFPVRDPSVS